MLQRIHTFYTNHRFISAVVGSMVFFVFSASGLVLVNGETLEPNDSHVVNLYVDGQEMVVPTRANTVGEMIEKIDVDVREHDIVEPSYDSEITTDGFRVRIARAKPYVVRDNGKELAAISAHTSARLIAEAAGLNLKPADKVEFAKPSDLAPSAIGREVIVTRSKTVVVSIYGSLQTVQTNASLYSELLKELGITPAEDDEVTPVLSTLIVDGGQLFINRNGIKVVSEEVIIEPEVEYIQDNDLTIGSSVVRDPGKPGKKLVTYEIITQNDVEVSRKEISSVLVEQSVKKIVARGRASGQIGAEKTALMAAAGIREDEYAAADFIISKESGWCATKWQGQWGQCPEFYAEKYPGAETDKSLGYGLCQSTPAIKMASAGDDWRTNPVTQLKWCTGYARARYGGWNNAYEVWITQRWW